jgi:hypothetical protein
MIGQYVTVFGDVISHVNISTVKPDDGGEYECVAENRAGRTSHAARLNIYGKLSQRARDLFVRLYPSYLKLPHTVFNIVIHPACVVFSILYNNNIVITINKKRCADGTNSNNYIIIIIII